MGIISRVVDMSRTQTQRCDVCGEEKEKNRDKFWGQTYKYCPNKHTPRCWACIRFEQGEKEKFVNLGDGRKLCSDCYSIATMDQEQFESLTRTVRKFHKSLGLELEDELADIRLVNKDAMRILHHDSNVIGLTLSYAGGIMTIESCSKEGDNIVLKKTSKISEINRTTIAVLFGQPDVQMGAILVHEMMHAWLRLKGVRGLEREVEEGICQVISYEWMRWFFHSGVGFLNKTSEQAQFARKFKVFFAKQLKTGPGLYPRAYRKTKQVVAKYGLKTTIDYIVGKRCLPPLDHDYIHELDDADESFHEDVSKQKIRSRWKQISHSRWVRLS